jgi:hypothetical protein
MASLTGIKFKIRCWKCGDTTNFVLPADEDPDVMVQCRCGKKAGLYGDLRLAADGEPHTPTTAELVPADRIEGI